MTIKGALNWASKPPHQNKVWCGGKAISSLEAEVLLAYLLNKDKIWLYKNPDFNLTGSQIKRYQKLVNRRLKGEPIAYITNRKEFYGLDFYVDKRVLIPRPETEILVEEVIKQLKTQILNLKTIADIGTGSGCISVAIAKQLKIKNLKLKIYAIDISKKALEVAKINAKKHQILNKIKFLHGDLLLPLPEKVDLIVANIPYVATDFDDINSFEPKIALFGGKDGLDLIKKLLKQTPKYLNKKGRIFLEISYHQKRTLEKIIPQYLLGYSVKFKKDLANLYRIAHIYSKGKGG